MKSLPRVVLTLGVLISLASGCSEPTQPEGMRTPPAPVGPVTAVGTDSTVIFNNLQWLCPMGCSVSIENFHDHVPSGTAIRVFVGAGGWIEAKPEREWTEDDRFV